MWSVRYQQRFTNVLILSYFLIGFVLEICNGHGRLIEPPSRASAWRYGFQTPPNYNDHELYCGGFSRQYNKNGGKCGECGDPFDVPRPRPHEFGGKYGQGVIVRKYNPGSEISLRVELTASHMGYFEFRLCPSVQATQECLDKNVLKIIGGTPSGTPQPLDLDTRFYPRNGSRIYDIRGVLPEGMKCEQCVVQWRYIAGNNWGTCADGTGAVGCGDQEEFRACSDISIGSGGATPSLRPRPGTKLTPQTSTTESTKEPETGSVDIDAVELVGPSYIGVIIVVVALVIVVCGLACLYLYYYHGTKVKHLLRWRRDKSRAMETEALPPVPPPRTKRLSNQVREIGANESSILSGATVNKNCDNSQPPECA